MREVLKGKVCLHTKTNLRTYIINNVIGKGATCIVYDAYYLDELGLRHNVRIKECYPDQYTEGHRNNNEIIWHNEDEKKKGLEAFQNTYKKQLFFQNNSLFTNSTGKITDELYEGNNTKYSVLDYSNSETFEHIDTLPIHDIIKVGIALTELVSKYHKHQYLLLDLKPDNFLVIEETKEMVYFIDFDSVKHIDALLEDPESISFSKEWAAPELLQGRIDKVGYHTDIYAIGAILYSKILKKKVSAKERSMHYKFPVDDLILPPKALHYLQELFSHTLSNNPHRRYKDCSELLTILNKLEKLTDPSAMYLNTHYPIQDNYFIGRRKELDKIDTFFNEGNHVLYISGYGGIGKTELAKYYCLNNSYGFDTIIWLNYKESIDSLIMKDDTFDITNTNKSEYNNKETKLRLLKHLVDDHTLIILDNYDKQDPQLIDLISLPCKFLITTRLQFKDLIDGNYSKIMHLGVLEREECFNVFKKYYDVDVMDEENDYIYKIIDLVERYSLIIPLIAKELRVSDRLPSEKYHQLIKYGIKKTSREPVSYSKDNLLSKETIYEHLKLVFNTAQLTLEAKRMLYIFTILGDVRITQTEISFYTGLMDNADEILEQDITTDLALKNKDHIQLDTVHYLMDTGWLEYDEKRNMLTCHPIIRELIDNECRMPFRQLEFFYFYIKKIAFKLKYDYISERDPLFIDKFIMFKGIEEEHWPQWISSIYEEFIIEVLKHKSFYDEKDVYDYLHLLKFIYHAADIEFADYFINRVEEIRLHHPNLVPDLSIYVLALLMAVKDRVFILSKQVNKYRKNQFCIKEAKRFIQLSEEIIKQNNDLFLIFQYREKVVYVLFIAKELFVDCDGFTEFFKENIREYLKIYKEMLKDHPEIKNENIYDFDDDREFFTWELEDELESEPIEKPTNGLFSAVNLFDDYEKIEYDSSAYEDINNDDVENLKKDFLHHVYDYCFDLLISDQVTTRYKNEQLNIHNDSDEIMSEDDEIPECDEEYISATYFLNTLKNDLIENIDTDILFNNWYGKKYYRGLKHFLILLDFFSENTYRKPDSIGGRDFSFLTYFGMILTFGYLGYPEMSTELCRILSIYHYNKENYNNGGYEDLFFKVEPFYDFYLEFAKKSGDQKAYYNALKNIKHITHAQFDYASAYEPDDKVDTEKMWQEIRILFEKMEKTTLDTRDSMKAEIESNPYIIDKYKKLLFKCLYDPFTMADQYGLLDFPKPICMLNPSDKALMDAFNKLNTDLNMVETIYAYSEICYQYILKGEDELYFKYSEEFGNVLGQLEDYHGKIDYLALSALSRYLMVCLSYYENEERVAVIISGCHMITEVVCDYIGDKWKNFDYITMKLCFYPIFRAFAIEELYAGLCEEEQTFMRYDSLCRELESFYQYLDKTWIGENHIVNDQWDANRNDGRLDGVFTKERQEEYLIKTQELIDAWKDEDHTKEEYQEKYKQFLDECFPVPEEDLDRLEMIEESIFKALRGESNG